MIGKVTALFKTERWLKRPRLDQISTSADACAILEVLMHDQTTHRTLFTPFGHSWFHA